jgi:hypothetical protein
LEVEEEGRGQNKEVDHKIECDFDYILVSQRKLTKKVACSSGGTKVGGTHFNMNHIKSNSFLDAQGR